MNQSLTDRRSRNTRNAIRASLFALCKSKDIRRITVKEICDMAEINRSTFYKHYESLQILINEISEEKAQKLIDEYDRAFHPPYSFQEVSTSIFHVLREDPDIYHWILSNRSSHGHQFLYRYLEQSFVPRWLFQYPHIPDSQVNWVFTFLIEGSLSVFKKYCEDNYPENIAEINTAILQLTEKGLDSYV